MLVLAGVICPQGSAFFSVGTGILCVGLDIRSYWNLLVVLSELAKNILQKYREPTKSRSLNLFMVVDKKLT